MNKLFELLGLTKKQENIDVELLHNQINELNDEEILELLEII